MAQISQEELTSLQQAVGKLNEAKIMFSDISSQAYQAQLEIFKYNEMLNGIQKGLETKYGNISVDINTGEYEAVVEEAEIQE